MTNTSRKRIANLCEKCHQDFVLLVFHLACFDSPKDCIYETTTYLELFLKNLLLNKQNPLLNRALHISGAFKEPEKMTEQAAYILLKMTKKAAEIC